jgi:elongation factor G
VAHTKKNLRNVALVGHSGSGKTSLAEAILFVSGKLNRMGRIQEGSTVCDYDSEEIERQISLRTSMVTTEWDGAHLNLLDSPGYADFASEVKSALRVSDGCLVVVESVTGVDVGTERSWRYAEESGLPRLIFINKMDRPDIDLDQVLQQIKDRFGRQAVPLQHPVNHGEGFSQLLDAVRMKLVTYKDGKTEESELGELESTAQQLHEQLVEAVAETDEELMEKYFTEGDLSAEELAEGIHTAVLRGELFPVIFGDAFNAVGIDAALSAIVGYLPSAAESPGIEKGLEGSSDSPLAAYVFKTLAEQHVGELNLVRLYSGGFKPGDEVVNSSRKANERVGQIFELNGHERAEVENAIAGDIVALVKLKNTHTGDTLCQKSNDVTLTGVEFPDPLIRVAISPEEKGSEERIATGLAQLRQEDPSFIFRYDNEIRQSLLQAQGDLHLETILKRLRERFGVAVVTEPPRIPYRETIRGNSEGHFRHKKQTGGRGQFGEVFLRIAPKMRGEGFEFINSVVGGNIPSNFIPAVEKGLQETMVEGPLSGSAVVDIAVDVYDGKHHPVDSDEVSFKIASSMAFKDAFFKAKPVLLEPIYRLTITVPEEFMGDVMGDLTSRRGRIIGTDADGHYQVISADAPLAEIDRYATTLRSMTQGKGIHTQQLDRYENVPGDVQSRVVAEAKERQAA